MKKINTVLLVRATALVYTLETTGKAIWHLYLKKSHYINNCRDTWMKLSFSIKSLCFHGMLILSLFFLILSLSLPGVDIMLLLDCDFPPLVVSSSCKCQKCPKRRKQTTLIHFSQNILPRASLSYDFCYLYLG